MSIEALKEKARSHEQKEEWRKALDNYRVAIAKLEDADEPDVGLYNRVGDLFVRIGNFDEAFSNYEKAVDLYVEAGLQNNAIAVCKKVIRGLPGRSTIYLRMGQIRAEQGFLSDARTNFLLYAEQMQEAGDLDESFRALVEFCDIAPEDVDLRIAVGDQLASHERVDEAVAQLKVAYGRLMLDGDTDRGTAVGEQILELDPSADLTVPDPADLAAGAGAEVDFAASYGQISLDEAPAPAVSSQDDPEVQQEASPEEEMAASSQAVEEAEAAMPDDAGVSEAAETGAEDLPVAPLHDEIDGADIVGELPSDAFISEDDDDAADLPLMDFSSAAQELEAAAEELHGAAGSREALEEALEETAGAGDASVGDLPPDEVRARIDADPANVELRQRLLEMAYQSGEQSQLVDAFIGLGRALEHTGERVRAKVSYQQALELDPTNETARAALGEAPPPESQPVQEVASHEDYVDLGSMILGDQEETTTRFVVAYEEPTGDEEADFAKMLTQFKEKVSENLDADDVMAHHDLGTAYKEMGLLDEAVSEFQQALRASASHLPTYELLGQTFIEMGKPEAAVRSLQRALDMEFEVEDELLAIYYYLGRAYEEVGNTKDAIDFYDRVFSLDINFADVTDRLRALR